ncbi:MAG: hypothetical protein HY680_01550 [Chloroflexi bacterium]|nr:hypothetical protein [Chloroflexota bacterium]
MVRIQVLNPVAPRFIKTTHRPASRLQTQTLNGKVVGLYWNLKPGGEVALKRISERLAERFSNVSFRWYSGSMGGGRTVLTTADADLIARECDVVIGTSAD